MIAVVWTESARAGFSELLPPDVELPKFSLDVFRTIVSSEAVRILLAEDEGGELHGYCAFGANRDPDAEPGVGEIRTFFVAPASWRRGVGTELLRAVLDGLREMGYEAASLWSFADNPRANAFYERAGFERDGSERTEEVWGHVTEVRYRRSLRAR